MPGAAMAWNTGTVLSENPQQGERYLVRKVREETKGRFSAKEVKQQMSDHLRLGRLELRHHPRSRRMGLKVVERCEDAADTVCEDAEG